MAREFNFNIGDKSAKDVVGNAKDLIIKKGGSFGGTDSEGHFNVMNIKGYFEIKDKNVKVGISSKPMLIPWGMIEGKLKDYFS